jgi:hypothetical protein
MELQQQEMNSVMTGQALTHIPNGMSVKQAKVLMQNQKDMLNMRMRQLRGSNDTMEAAQLLGDMQESQEAQLASIQDPNNVAEIAKLQKALDDAKLAKKETAKTLKAAARQLDKGISSKVSDEKKAVAAAIRLQSKAEKALDTNEDPELQEDKELALTEARSKVFEAEATLETSKQTASNLEDIEKLQEAVKDAKQADADADTAISDSKTNLDERMKEIGMAVKQTRRKQEPPAEAGDSAAAAADADGAHVAGEAAPNAEDVA